MADLPIDVKTFEFSNDVENFEEAFKIWRSIGSHRKLTIIAATQSSWYVGGLRGVEHLITIFYTEGEYPSPQL